MKTKSKLLIISSFALAMVASLVMAFAMMNVAKTERATVSANGLGTWEDMTNPKYATLYVNKGEDTNLWIHYWNKDYSTDWVGVQPVSVGGGWWKLSIHSVATSIIISGNAGDSGGWYSDTEISGLSFEENGIYKIEKGSSSATEINYYLDEYYVFGSMHSWNVANLTDDYKMTKLDGSGDKATISGLELEAGDNFKILYPASNSYYGSGSGVDKTNAFFSDEDGDNSNAIINYDATYKIVLNNNYRVWVSPDFSADDLFTTVKKIAESKNYFLAITGFDYDKLTTNLYGLYYKVGYEWSVGATSGTYLTPTVYTGVVLNTASGNKGYDVSKIYDGKNSTDHKLIIAEIGSDAVIPCAVADDSSISVTPVIKVYSDSGYSECIYTVTGDEVTGTI